MWLRQVIVPNLNDNEQNIEDINKFISNLKNIEKVELLPYKTIGVHKYADLKMKYRLDGVPEMNEIECKRLEKLINLNN